MGTYNAEMMREKYGRGDDYEAAAKMARANGYFAVVRYVHAFSKEECFASCHSPDEIPNYTHNDNCTRAEVLFPRGLRVTVAPRSHVPLGPLGPRASGEVVAVLEVMSFEGVNSHVEETPGLGRIYPTTECRGPASCSEVAVGAAPLSGPRWGPSRPRLW